VEYRALCRKAISRVLVTGLFVECFLFHLSSPWSIISGQLISKTRNEKQVKNVTEDYSYDLLPKKA
jgi:hypothetical protein